MIGNTNVIETHNTSLFLHKLINMAYKEDELKWVINTATGLKRQIGPNIYNNQFRMRSGNWRIIEAPPELVKLEPVTVNVPSEPVIQSTETPKPQPSNKKGK